MAVAVKTSRPSARLQAGSQRPRRWDRVWLDSGTAICMKYLLYGSVEVTREGDRQWKRRRVALGLDRVDRLARDVHLLGEPLLGKPQIGAESSNLVSHLM